MRVCVVYVSVCTWCAGLCVRVCIRVGAGASCTGKHELVRVLLRFKADVNAKDDGCTALYLAAQEGHGKVVQVHPL
jgi:hypothetical protein